MHRMRLLDALERIGEMPAEVWLIPPILILAGMAAISWLLRVRMLGRYRAIAEHTGLTVVRKFFNPSEVRGSFRGRQLVMTTGGRRRQTFRRRWTWVTVDVTNPELIGFQMWQQGAIDRLIITAGGTEIVVGNPEFDRRFVIRSRDEALVANVLRDPELQQLILTANIDSIDLQSARLLAYYARIERKPAHAELLFTAVTRLAEAVDTLKVEYKPEIIRT
jgi:hypothetical protein